jgi:hypothetical protein
MDGLCSTRGRGEKYKQILAGKPERRNLMEDIGIDVRIIMEGALQK